MSSKRSSKVSEYIECNCTGKTYKTGSSYNAHQKSMVHQFWETKKELKDVRRSHKKQENTIKAQANHIETLNKNIEDLEKELEIQKLSEEKAYYMSRGKFGKQIGKKKPVKKEKKYDID